MHPQPRSALSYSMWLVGPLALACAVAKTHKVLATGGDVGVLLGALFPDVLFAAALGASSHAALRFTSGGINQVARFVMHAMVLLATVLVFVEHGFWVTTGTLLDPAVLGYGLTHFDTLGDVYLSAMGPLVWLGVVALLMVHVLPIKMARSAKTPPLGTRPTAIGTIGAFALVPLVTGIGALVGSAPSLAPLSGNVVFTCVAHAMKPASAQARASGTGDTPPLVLGRGPRAVPEGRTPNVIIIMMESVRAASTTPYDATVETTPFLARLAERGAVVDRTWTSMTHTSKALVSALCGVHPMLDLPVVEADAPGIPTECLARVLSARGYATAFMQPATGSFEQRRQLTENMAFETFISKESIAPGDHEETNYFGWEDEALLEPALGFAATHQAAGRPFFLTLLNLSTHHTYDTPSDFEKVHRDHGEYGKYLDSIRYFDGFIADLFAGLEASGALEHTLVVLAGDHGEAFGEHGTWQHNAAIHEEGLHVPVVLVGPGIKPGTRIGGLRQLVDLMPTVLDWLGTPVVSGLPGKSLLTSMGHDAVFASCWLREQCMATRDATWKYIWNYDKRAPELYDLTRDPLERNDVLANTPEAIWGPLKARLMAWESETNSAWRRFRDSGQREYVSERRPEVDRPLDVTFSDGEGRALVRLLGIDAPRGPVASDRPIELTIHWEVLSEMPGWYPFTYLLGRTKGATELLDANHPIAGGRHPVRRWQRGTFVSDRFEIRPGSPLPPGAYELALGFFNPTTSGVAARAHPRLDEGRGRARHPNVDDERRALVTTIEVVPPAGAKLEVVRSPSGLRGGLR